MASKEDIWLKKRVGVITASELSAITSKSGRIIEGCVDFIRSKRWERKHGFAHPVSAKAMDIGNEQEPYIAAWCRANLPFETIVYSKELPEITIWSAPDCPLGASPDAYTPDERIVLEFKTLVGAKGIEFFDDEYTPAEEKKKAVLSDHGDQLLGQFISNPKVEEIWLIKYIYCDDSIMEDRDSPLAPWRGHVFKFLRKDYVASIDEMKKRICLIDKMIDAPINPSEFKSGEWYLDKNGELKLK